MGAGRSEWIDRLRSLSKSILVTVVLLSVIERVLDFIIREYLPRRFFYDESVYANILRLAFFLAVLIPFFIGGYVVEPNQGFQIAVLGATLGGILHVFFWGQIYYYIFQINVYFLVAIFIGLIVGSVGGDVSIFDFFLIYGLVGFLVGIVGFTARTWTDERSKRRIQNI